MLSAAVAATASITGLLRAWPQVFGIVRGENSTGVSDLRKSPRNRC